MAKKSDNSLMEVFKDSGKEVPTARLEVSATALELAKTITSASVELKRYDTEIEITRMKKEAMSEYNAQKFAQEDKLIEKTFDERGKVLDMASAVINDGIKKDKDYMVLDALHTAAGIVTNNPFSQNPDFRKKLDAGQRLELGND